MAHDRGDAERSGGFWCILLGAAGIPAALRRRTAPRAGSHLTRSTKECP
jgi:hypothetical protein